MIQMCIFLLLSVLLLSLANEITINSPNLGIINGTEAEPNQFPYQAYIIFIKENNFTICSGSLISRLYVLSSAHCAQGSISAEVYLGSTNTSEQVKYIGDEIVIHPNFYDGERLNDAAIIKLTNYVTLRENIQVIKLPPNTTEIDTYEGAAATVGGWGQTDPDSPNSYSYVLRYIYTTILGDMECFYRLDDFSKSQICSTSDDFQSFCEGDSGAPLVVDGVQVGIASYVSGGCRSNGIQIYTYLPMVVEWIMDNSDVIIN